MDSATLCAPFLDHFPEQPGALFADGVAGG